MSTSVTQKYLNMQDGASVFDSKSSANQQKTRNNNINARYGRIQGVRGSLPQNMNGSIDLGNRANPQSVQIKLRAEKSGVDSSIVTT